MQVEAYETIQAPGGPAYEIAPVIVERLSRLDSAKGRLQRVALAVLLGHRDDGELPTNGRFVFYELEQRGVVNKKRPGEKGRRGDQDLIDALYWLREQAIVPWDWLVDETRRLWEWSYAPTVAGYLSDRVDEARINPWQSDPPLLLTESRSLAGVLRNLAAEYLCPIAATNGQVGGFLRTDVLPLLRSNHRSVRYLGDHDLCGDQIEENTRRVLEREAGREIDWQRLAITAEQARDLEPIVKKDSRYTPPRVHEAWETEALGQTTVMGLVRDALDALLPEPLDDVLEREQAQRDDLRARLNGNQEA